MLLRAFLKQRVTFAYCFLKALDQAQVESDSTHPSPIRIFKSVCTETDSLLHLAKEKNMKQILTVL